MPAAAPAAVLDTAPADAAARPPLRSVIRHLNRCHLRNAEREFTIANIEAVAPA